MTNEEAEEFLDKHARQIGEHFDAVQILASYTDDSETHCLKSGSGNWYARQGMAHEFIQGQNADLNAHSLAEELKEE